MYKYTILYTCNKFYVTLHNITYKFYKFNKYTVVLIDC